MFAPPGERHRDCCTADTVVYDDALVYDDAQCVQLVSMFCQFFVDNISAAL